MQFLPCLVYPRPIIRVNDEDESLRALSPNQLCACRRLAQTKCTRKVMSPQRPDLVLSANVPDVELDVLIGNRFDIETNGGNSGDVLVQLKLVENG